MGITSFGNKHIPTDAEIERDVAELRNLLSGVDNPSEPHPAYWQNFVVNVRKRIDDGGAKRKAWRFSPAWASLSAAAVVTIIVVTSGILDQLPPPPPAYPPKPVPVSLGDSYSQTNTRSLVLSEQDVRMINAIVSDDRDDAIFETLVDSQ